MKQTTQCKLEQLRDVDVPVSGEQAEEVVQFLAARLHAFVDRGTPCSAGGVEWQPVLRIRDRRKPSFRLVYDARRAYETCSSIPRLRAVRRVGYAARANANHRERDMPETLYYMTIEEAATSVRSGRLSVEELV